MKKICLNMVGLFQADNEAGEMIIHANSYRIPIHDKSVHCVVTSPPYWGLRDYQIDGQLGLEKTPEEFIENMVRVFREVWRVLRDDGTLWLNLGDTYAGSGGNRKGNEHGQHDVMIGKRPIVKSKRIPRKSNRRDKAEVIPSRWGGGNAPASGYLKPKDLCMIPARVAMALQADGWYLRSDIIWAKPNPMPESVTDRPTKNHEYIFLLTKKPKYFYDADAIRENGAGRLQEKSYHNPNNGKYDAIPHERWKHQFDGRTWGNPAGRNKRSVWTIATQSYGEAHFATFPAKIVHPCIAAGTSERGVCSECGAPWARVVEKGFSKHNGKTDSQYKKGSSANRLALLRQSARENGGEYVDNRKTIGWQPSCECNADVAPAVVFDPFGGSGTVKEVAGRMGRHGIVTELKFEYCQLAKKRCGYHTPTLDL